MRTVVTKTNTWSDMHAGMGRMANGQGGGEELMQCVKVGKLNLVDLAGSERVHITGATGMLLVMLHQMRKPAMRCAGECTCCS
jgi:hypothetical protein